MQTACTHMLHESEAAGQLWFVRETHTHRFDNVAAPLTANYKCDTSMSLLRHQYISHY